MAKNAALTWVSAMHGAARRELQLDFDYTHYEKNKKLRVVDTKHRGMGSAKVTERGRKLKEKHLRAIAAFVDRSNTKEGAMAGVFQIRAHLQQKFGIVFSRQVIEYALNVRLGYSHSEPEKGAAARTEKRALQIRHYLLQYDLALKKQAAGKAVIVYMRSLRRCP